MCEPKERYLMMSGSMVRAYRRGQKTETRRLSGVWEVGDVAWWKESFAFRIGYDDSSPLYMARHKDIFTPTVFYRADGDIYPLDRGRWRSPLHMPRAFSRISTTILEVRRESLHAITEDGAQAEGFASRAEFAACWDRLHGSGAWDSNPEVLVLRWDPYEGNSR